MVMLLQEGFQNDSDWVIFSANQILQVQKSILSPEPIKTFWKPFPVHPYQPYSLNHPVLTGTHQPVIQVRQVSFFIDTKIRNHKIFSAKHTWSSSNVVKWKNAKCASATSDWFLSLPLLIGPNFIPISWYIQVQNHLENFSFGLFSSSDTLF